MKRLLNYTRRLIDGMLPERNARCKVSPTDAQNTTGSFDSLYKVGKKLSSKPHHGIAYEGIRKSDDKQVIIKSVKNHLFDFHMEDSKPLCREAAIMRMVEDSDHVVKLLEWFGMKDHDILIMEHPGTSTTLFDHIKANGSRLDEAEAKDIMQKLISVLRHCSEQDVYYKGISLKKVLIDQNTRQIKLTGFYRALTTRETRKGDRKSSGERRTHALMETNKGLRRVLKGMVKGEWFHGKTTDLSKECLDLLQKLRHRESWITLQNIFDHDWFSETSDPATESEPTDGVCDSVENLHKTEKDKTSSSQDQTSQHVTSTSEAEVLPIAEEPGHAKVDDEWSDVSFQDLVGDCRDDVPQVTDCATSDCGVNNVHVGPTGDTVSPPLKKLEDNKIIDTGYYSYEIGRKLGEGAYGSVYAGIRLKDGLEVALKFAVKVGIEYIDIEGLPEPVPKEIGLLILANKGSRIPQIIELLDWVEEPERYIMVLELPKACEDLFEFRRRHEGYIKENVAKAIMQQVTFAAQTCCQRGVLHRDIKLENLLINPDTLEVKLIDFGCGKILTNAGYTSFAGTEEYCPPEFDLNGEYHGEPATVWSLGIVLFELLCGQNPDSEELDKLNDNIWTKEGLSQECCELLCSLLQRNPEKRLELDNVWCNSWYKKCNCQPENNEIIDTGFYSYEIGRKLGEGAYGIVYAGIRFEDGLEVALKFADKVGIEYIDIEGLPEPVPKEIGLLILANKGPRVPQIIQLLDWVEEPERYIMVLELAKPCENLIEFYKRLEGYIGESKISAIMQQVTLAAQTCCQRGVLHRNIKLRNLLINPDTLEVKLIDFGCGEILTNAGYTSYAGTLAYSPPEFHAYGEYHGEPATVWSLGIVLFLLLFGEFPESEDLDKLNDNIWTADGLSQECCELLCSLLQRNPEKRLELDNVCRHNWFKKLNCQPENEIIDTGYYSYEIGRKLGEGAYGSVYAGIRLKDGLEVALKFANKVGIEYIDIEGLPEPVPKEIGLLILASRGPRVPQIIQLLDWVEEPERYIMVLELPKPCENLFEFCKHLEGYIGESKVSAIMQQVTLAAQTCCQRGVLHRDIKLQNLLINPDTLEVKLIDFGCGEILTNAGYTYYAGTLAYCPPEFDLNGEYHGEPATVWSLGIVLFALMCWKFPESEDLDKLNDNTWTKEGLSQECCELLCSLLQRNPEKRLELDNVCRHNWFRKFNCQPENNEIIEKSPDCRKRPGWFLRLWKATKGVISSSSSSAVNVVEPFIPPADPDHSAVKPNNEKAPERWKRPGWFLRLWKATKGVFSSSSSSAVNAVEPFIPPADPDHSAVKPNNGRPRSWRTASPDSSPGITSASARPLPEVHVERRCRESLRLCSRGTYSVEGRWSGDGSESPNQQGLSRSDSVEEFLCPPLPGQVPVEPKK